MNQKSIFAYVMTIVISSILIGTIIPTALIYLGSAGDQTAVINGTSVALSDAVDPAIVTLLTLVLPLMIVVGLISAFMYFKTR